MHFWPCSASQSLSAIGFWSCSPVLQVPELLQKLPALALQLARLLLFMCNRPLLRIPCSKVTKHLTSAPFDFIFPRFPTIFYMFYHVFTCFYIIHHAFPPSSPKQTAPLQRGHLCPQLRQALRRLRTALRQRCALGGERCELRRWRQAPVAEPQQLLALCGELFSEGTELGQGGGGGATAAVGRAAHGELREDK